MLASSNNLTQQCKIHRLHAFHMLKGVLEANCIQSRQDWIGHDDLILDAAALCSIGSRHRGQVAHGDLCCLSLPCAAFTTYHQGLGECRYTWMSKMMTKSKAASWIQWFWIYYRDMLIRWYMLSCYSLCLCCIQWLIVHQGHVQAHKLHLHMITYRFIFKSKLEFAALPVFLAALLLIRLSFITLFWKSVISYI